MIKVRPAHLGASQVRPCQHGAVIGASKICLAEICIGQIAMVKVSSGQVGLTEVGAFDQAKLKLALTRIACRKSAFSSFVA